MSSSFDGTLRIWDASRGDAGTPVAIARHTADINSLGMSADGRILATGSRDQTAVFGMPRLVQLLSSRRTSQRSRSGHSAPMETLSASAAQDGSVMLWDVKTGREMLSLRRSATLVAFSPTGLLLATAGGPDKRVTVWNVSIDTWADRACSIANRNLTCEEWRQYIADSPYQPVCPRLPSPRDCDGRGGWGGWG